MVNLANEITLNFDILDMKLSTTIKSMEIIIHLQSTIQMFEAQIDTTDTAVDQFIHGLNVLLRGQ